jgi:outer membrane protein assembly factor BamB
MSWSSRRAILVLIVVLAMGCLAFWQQAAAQRAVRPAVPVDSPAPGPQPLPGVGPSRDGFDLTGLTLPRDNRLTKQIEAAVDYIEASKRGESRWDEVCRLLQLLIDHPQDVFAQLPRKGPKGKTVYAWVSVKKEANRLLGSLPRQGREFYELTYGPKAQEMVEKARDNGDKQLMGVVMSRFLYTRAGAQAAEWLATHLLDRGDYVGSARYFKLLIQRGGAEEIAPKTLFKAAYAFHQAGDADAEAEAWKHLQDQTSEIRLADRSVSLGELKDYVNGLVRVEADRNIHDHPLYRGNLQRNGQGFGGTAFLVPRWSAPLLVNYGDPSENGYNSAQRYIQQAREQLEGLNQPILSTFFPITVTVSKNEQKDPLVIYRSYWGIHAVHIKTGKVAWYSPNRWSLQRMLETNEILDARIQQAVTRWLGSYFGPKVKRFQILFENSTVGSLSADEQYVYTIDDLAIPPTDVNLNRMGRGGYSASYGEPLNEAVSQNKLQAFSLVREGALAWEQPSDNKGPLADSFFLGPPLPVDGKLYVLNEKQQELRLVQLDPDQQGKVLSIQTLATTRNKMEQEIGRRIRAAHLAYGEGILVCPTNAGALFGVDLLSGSLVWAYPYSEADSTSVGSSAPRPGVPPGLAIRRTVNTNPIQSLNNEWRISAPIIHDGKVIFTAPDAQSIHCVDLRGGSKLWARSRADDDLYLAGVFKNTVLVIGKQSAKGYSLEDGKLLWKLDTGLPSGQGVASDNIYYLPLQSAARTKEPEICAIDVLRGQVVAHTRSRKLEVPGNLLFYQGDVVSQGVDQVVAYPQLAVKLAQMDALLEKDPNDPLGLTERGELRLDKGDLGGAVADLRKALDNKPPEDTREKARRKLYEAFTEYFQRDFTQAKPYLDEYEQLCTVEGNPVEERRRKANFLCLVAKGREKEGDLLDAFERYQQFVEVAGHQELISVVDEPAVKAAPDVWSQGRIAAMVANATPENRKPLEDLINRKWQELRISEKASVDDLRNFVKTFGSLFRVGKEARLILAERLMEEAGPRSLLEAELELSLLRGPQESPELAARAVETLARLNMRKGLLEDAAYYYRLLGTRYASVIVSDGKTGEELLNQMFTDPRLLPHLDSPGQLGGGGQGRQITTTEETGSFGYTSNTYYFPQAGEPLPFFARNQLSMRFNLHQLRITDTRTGEELMSKNLTPTQFQNMISRTGGNAYRVKFSFQNVGHLTVLPVGHMVFGIDPVKGEVLWEKNLLGNLNRPGLQGFNFSQIGFDPRDDTVQVTYPDGWVQRLGQSGQLGGAVLCIQTYDALEALDPLTGRTLWTRNDIGQRSHVFSDDQHVYIVEVGADGSPSSTRVFRAYDGVSVNVPDFADLYQKRLWLSGNRLLLSEKDATNAVHLRLYDILTGKDLWKQSFPTGSIVLESEGTHLTGVLEPNGQVHVFDLDQQKPVLQTKLYYPEHARNVTRAHLLSDGRYLYVTLDNPNNAAARVGGTQSALYNNSGLRALPVNGWVYCWEIRTGNIRWFNPAVNQMLILNQFHELPLVLFAARHNELINNGRGTRQVVEVKAIDKRTGKHVHESTSTTRTLFHHLNVDVRGGTIEFIGDNRKITFHLRGNLAKK